MRHVLAAPTILAIMLFVASAAAQDAAAAEALLAARGCRACHSLDGTPQLGPSFARADTHPHQVTTDGTVHEEQFDADYVRRSILDPDADLAGRHPPGAMPRLAHDEADADALTAAVLLIARRVPGVPADSRSPIWLVLAALAFVLGHFALSSSVVRPRLVARLGESAFSGVYSLIVLAAFVWLVFEWIAAPYVELYRPAGWTRWIPNVVMPIAYTLLIAGYTTKSPTIAGLASAVEAGPTGFLRITRHPALWGFALWGLSHLGPNGDLRSLCLMGGVAVLALGGMVHIDARRRAAGGEAWTRFERATSVLPFAAIARGEAWPTFRELGWWRIALGIGGWAVMLVLHPLVLGVSPLP